MQIRIFFPNEIQRYCSKKVSKSGVLPAQCGVILHPLNLILQLLNPTNDVHVLLLQHAKPQFIPQQGHSTQFTHQLLYLLRTNTILSSYLSNAKMALIKNQPGAPLQD